MEVDEEGRVAAGEQHHLQLHHGAPPLRGQLHLHRQLLARLPVPGQVHLHRNTPRNTCITRCTATHHATPALLGVSAPQHTTQHVHYQVQLHRTTPRNTYFTSCTCTVLHHATHALPGASAPYLTPQYVLYQVHLHHIIPRNTCITRYICTYHTSKQVSRCTTPRTLPGAPASYHTKQCA